MAERRKTIPDPEGNPVEGVVVDVNESTERFSEVSLTDGTKLRIKPVVTEALRQDGKWDSEGNPKYLFRTANVVAIVDAPATLKQQ